MRPRCLSESLVPAPGRSSSVAATQRWVALVDTHTCVQRAQPRAWARELVEAFGTTAMQTHSSAGWSLHLGSLSWSNGKSIINKTHGGFWMHSFEVSLTRGRNMPCKECTTYILVDVLSLSLCSDGNLIWQLKSYWHRCWFILQHPMDAKAHVPPREHK